MDHVKTLMLFGKAGVGKSATANTLSGITVFKSERSASSVTVQPQAVDFGYNGISYRIVDTVGLDPALFKKYALLSYLLRGICSLLFSQYFWKEKRTF